MKRSYRIRPVFLLLLLTTIISAFVAPSTASAQAPDTTWVRVFENYLWTWNGGQNRWGLFPDSTHRYEKILMHYRLKCPTGGCGEWDYTTNVYIMHHTGRIDSVLDKAPSVRVDGAVKDSVPISTDTTWVYTWNTTTKKVDTAASTPLKLTYFADALNPWRQTDSAIVWPAGYYTYKFDATGKKIDSAYVTPSSILRVTTVDAYRSFEVVVPYEIGRFITPYGKWFAKDREFDWVFDVTEYAYLLRDSVEIRTFYDGWSQGSLYTLDFELIEGIPPYDVYKVENIYGGAFAYGNPNDPIENHLPAKNVMIDTASKTTFLKIVTTGHGFGGTENAAEFSDKTHNVQIDGMQRFSQHLWRDDCGQNPVFPQAGTWYFLRGGWCPGDLVRPDYYNLTPFATLGDSLLIDYNMQPYTNADLSKPATYIIQSQVIHGGAPNFANDVAVVEIKKPANDFMHRRMNPICSNAQPVVVIRNTGGQPLTSAKIDYTAGEVSGSYTWQGNLAFLGTAEVTLPPIDLGSAPGTFTVSVSAPNGQADGYAQNNTMTSSYALPKIVSGPMVTLQMRTDDYGGFPDVTNGIKYEVRNLEGTVLYSRSGFSDNVTVRDTFRLADGCYQFIIYDEYIGDGLYPIQGTPGSYILRDGNGSIILSAGGSPTFLASFGDREITTFSVKTTSGVGSDPQAAKDGDIWIYPNPAKREVTIDLSALRVLRGVEVSVTNVEGKELMKQTIPDDSVTYRLDLGDQPPGTYMVLVRSGEQTMSRKVVLGGSR